MKQLVAITVALAVSGAAGAFAQSESLFTIERTVATSGFDGTSCWVHARAGVVPGGLNTDPLVVMTTQKLLLSGSDVFYRLHELHTTDGAATWTAPTPHASFARQTLADGRKPVGTVAGLVRDGDVTTVCDFTPKWHHASGRLLGTGHTVWYRDNRVMSVRPRATAYAVYDPRTHTWSPWRTLQMPDDPRFVNAGAGCVQRYDLPDGDILLPVYFKVPQKKQYAVTVCRCRFDGENLTFVEHGNELTVPVKRGLYEPSLTHFGGRYFLTLRNDDHGYVSTSTDGLTFEPPRRWTFDDGEDLGSYNTQQHWVTHSDGLFLVYTRRGADNDHVFRHRAPLFIARVNPTSLQVVRASEQILVPERGARLGNFGVTDVSARETWVTVTEWMQPVGVEKHGSDNSVFVTRLKWKRPNRLIQD